MSCCTVTCWSEASRVVKEDQWIQTCPRDQRHICFTHAHTHVCSVYQTSEEHVWSFYSETFDPKPHFCFTAKLSWTTHENSLCCLSKLDKRLYIYPSFNEAIKKSFTNNLPTAVDLLRLTQLNQPASLFLFQTVQEAKIINHYDTEIKKWAQEHINVE